MIVEHPAAEPNATRAVSRATREPSDRKSRTVTVSVVVPCFNEQEVLHETHRRLSASLDSLERCSCEIIFVDDGSRDATPDILRSLAAADPRVKAVFLSRNFGHQIAVTAGIDFAAGDVVVLIDADLQDPPAVIAEMLDAWRAGADVAYGQRRTRSGESTFKLATAKLFYRLLDRLSEVQIPMDTGDFRLMDRQVVEALRKMPERHRFIRGMVAWVGFSQVPIPYDRESRFAGTTKYPFARMLRFAVDGLTAFSVVPLRLATWFGFSAACIALVGILYALVSRLLTDQWVPGWAATFIAILFMAGAQLLCIGVIGEYLGRLVTEAKGRPLYLVSQVAGRTHER